MPTNVYGFDWPDRVVVGTLGEPGSRTFYLQARDGARVTSIVLEKEQSALLSEKIEEILDELMAGEGNPFSVPAMTPLELVDNDPLEQPVDPEFRTGNMTLGWDPVTAQLVIEAYPFVEVDEDAFGAATAEPVTAPMAVLRLRIPVGAARAFAKRTLEVVGAGRPICPLCGAPMDPGGHSCPTLGDFD